MAREDKRAFEWLRRIHVDLDGVKLEQNEAISQVDNERSYADNFEAELARVREAKNKADQEISSLKTQLDTKKADKEKPKRLLLKNSACSKLLSKT